MRPKKIFVECLTALAGLTAAATVHAACTYSGADMTCTGSNSAQTIPNGIRLFDLTGGASISGSIVHDSTSSPATINLNGTFTGWVLPGSNTTVNFNQSSSSVYLLTGNRDAASTGNTLNIATGVTVNGSNTIGIYGNQSTINVYGNVVGYMTAIITDDYGRAGQTSNTTLNLHPGSSVYGAFLPLQPVGEENFHLNANGSTLTAAHPALPAIRIIGGGPFATSHNGVYSLNDTTLVSPLAGIRLFPLSEGTTNNNQFVLTGNTRIDSGQYAIIVDGGTGNHFDIKGNTILQGNDGAAINTNGTFDTVEDIAPYVQASDVNRYTLHGNARIIGVTGTAFLGGLGQDIITLAENAQVSGDILTGGGDDSFSMSGGRLLGKLDMGDGDDSAVFINQTDASLTGITLADGGLGNDTLTFDSTTLGSLARFVNWETINLNNGSNVTLAGDLTLGDSVSGTGTLKIDTHSTLNTGNISIQPAIAGQMVRVNNAGLIDLTRAANSPGNILTINGHYRGNNGAIVMNTRLGDDNSPTDRLVVSGDTAGNSMLRIANSGGRGAMAQGNGIKVVEVGGNSAGQFKLAGSLITGIYEYDLYQGGVGADAGDGNWYLRAITGSPTPAPPPRTGIYLHNMAAASGMFMHTLHDRLGEPQFTDTRKDEKSGKVTSLWVRVFGSHTDSSAAKGEIGLDTDTTLVHLGGDLARWSNNGNDRWLFGLMGAYGRSDVDAVGSHVSHTSNGTRRTASGNVDGYAAGAYLTWYGNQNKPNGPYVDLWGMYGWYDNKVNGNGYKEQRYDSSSWTVSAETGYAFTAHDGEKRQLMVEPQVQIAYNSYSADDHYEHETNTWIRDSNTDGVTTRLGARLYSRDKLGGNGIQPFIEANWWYGSAKYDLSFNGQTISDDTPDSTYELKAGLQGEIAKGWQLWGHVGGRWGEHNYHSYEGMVGVKCQF